MPKNTLKLICQFKSQRAECSEGPEKNNVEGIVLNYESSQQDANIQVNLLFVVSSTCFGRCFRPSSGALNCIYSIW